MEKKMLPRRQLSQTQFIAYGFLVMILIGTLLLMLPIASRSGESQGFLDCLFTATSASCVTGLVIADTWSNWTVFGQLVILTMIQIGGLGFITIGVFISIILRRKIGLKERGLMQESVNTLQLSGVVKLARKIILGTALIEGTGAVLLSIRFVPRFGLVKGIYYGIFHSISAFCNAGFDLLGCDTPYMSLTGYSADWLVNLVIMSLIVIGGLGFIVWDDLSRKGLHFKSYMLHTKIVLLTTLALIFGGALLIGISERDNLMADMGPASKLLTIFLMYIGGSPGSTAGGVKTTTLIVLLLYLGSTIRRTHGVNIFGRRLEEDSIMRASCICTINLCLALTVATIILMMQNLDAMDVLLETFSAIGTVGMSSGITRELNAFSRIMVILLMYCGRIGSLSFALTFTQNMKLAKVRLPEEKITIG